MSTTIKSIWLKNENGEKVAPKTLASYVQTDDGTLLEDKIDELDNKIDKTGITLGLHTDGLIYIFINGNPTGDGIKINAEVVSGDVVGYVDGNNNIILSGNLPSGTYTLKYENDDETLSEIGTIIVGDGTEIGFTNLFNTETATYNTRFSTSGTKVLDGAFITDYIPISANGAEIFRMYGSDVCYPTADEYDSGIYTDTIFYDENYNQVGNRRVTTLNGINGDSNIKVTLVNGVYQFTIPAIENAVYMRTCAYHPSGNATIENSSDIIMTINELIGGIETLINQIPISIDSDGTVFNGTGYIQNKRLNSSGNVADYPSDGNPNPSEGTFVTGFIPVKSGDVIRLKNCWIDPDATADVYGASADGLRCHTYQSSFAFIEHGITSWSNFADENNTVWTNIVTDDNGNVVQFTIGTSTIVAYMRLTLGGDAENAVITIS